MSTTTAWFLLSLFLIFSAMRRIDASSNSTSSPGVNSTSIDSTSDNCTDTNSTDLNCTSSYFTNDNCTNINSTACDGTHTNSTDPVTSTGSSDAAASANTTSSNSTSDGTTGTVTSTNITSGDVVNTNSTAAGNRTTGSTSTNTSSSASGVTSTNSSSTSTGANSTNTNASNTHTHSHNNPAPLSMMTALRAEISADKAGVVKLNTQVTLTCEASDGSRPYTGYSWRKQGKTVAGHTSEIYWLVSKTKARVRVSCTVTDSKGDNATSEDYIVTFSGAVRLSTTVTWRVLLCFTLWLATSSAAAAGARF